MSIVQLFVPAKMIWDREVILNEGFEHKFRTAPIDPNDPFRGKYIVLRYAQNSVELEMDSEIESGSKVYVSFVKDDEGYSKIKSVSDEKPLDNENYLAAKANVYTTNDHKELTIEYPFDRYYMEESKAYDAELLYQKTQRDSNLTTYALVKIKNGGAVLSDVMINEISIRELVKEK